jgi:HSP20 family protein
MSRIQERFEIACPALSVYDALSQPETILGTLPGVSSIYRFDPTHYRMQVGSAGRSHPLDVEITERDPGRRLAWRCGDGRWAGSVKLQALDDEQTMVFIEVEDREENQALASDNGEASSVIDAALQHLKTALAVETSQAAKGSTRVGGDEEAIHISRGAERARNGSQQSGRAPGDADWQGSHSSFFKAEYPYAFMRMISREMDRWWEQLQRGAAVARRTVSNLPTGLNPPIEICERDNAVVVCADVPGMERDAVHVEVDDGLLTIRGERKTVEEEKNVRRTERMYGAFVRRIPLPEGLDVDSARAVLRNGVLEVRIPAPQLHRSRTVKVESDAPEPKG